MTRPMRAKPILTPLILAASMALWACDRAPVSGGGSDGEQADDETQTPQVPPAPSPSASPSTGPSSPATVSILRPEVEAEQQAVTAIPLEPLNATIGFPSGGSDLDEAALAGLADVLASDQIALGGPIVLRGHSDAGGSDRVNERAARARAEAVRSWLAGNGIDEARVSIIAFGEQNPIAPNALPDGTPNEEGRALNRRVEVLIVPPDEAGEEG